MRLLKENLLAKVITCKREVYSLVEAETFYTEIVAKAAPSITLLKKHGLLA